MKDPMKKPNIVFVFADEWPAHATGYAGDPNCATPMLDRLAAESVNVTHAVSGCPVCCPYRASLMTGQYPLTHGVYINDVELDPNCVSIARAFGQGGYRTAYIGKWHLYGSPDGQYGRRYAVVPRDYQLGFDYWKGFECCHDYNDSPYFFNDDPTPRKWEGYDALAQSRDAAQYIRDHANGEKPFMFTDRYTYVRNTDGPWLLYDRKANPYQMHNLASDPAHAPVRARLEAELQQRLDRMGDEFLDGRRYLERDGLTHYGEVKYGVSKPWVDPWQAK